MRSFKMIATIVLVGLLSFAAGSIAQPRYPEIDTAESALQSALGNLQSARNVFGGYKANAMRPINQAIGELEAGKQFAAAHGY
jgi:hypothetical protein